MARDLMTRTRRGFRRTLITVKQETFDWLDTIAETFEGSMPFGDLIDMLVDYAQKKKLEDAIFGSAVMTEKEEVRLWHTSTSTTP